MPVDRDFTQFSRATTSFARAHELVAAGASRVFTATTYPRAVRANAAGNLVMKDQDGVSITYFVAAGEVLVFSPSEIQSTSTIAAQVWW